MEYTNTESRHQPYHPDEPSEQVCNLIEFTNTKVQMWASNNGYFMACEEALAELVPGQYTFAYTDNGIVFKKHTINTDDLLDLPDAASKEVIDGLETFWAKEQHFRNLKFLWKRGILLYGPAGSGKTTTIQQISQLIVEKGGVSFYVDDPGLAAQALEVFRKV